MGITFHTEKINKNTYLKIFRRSIILNSSLAYWKSFVKDWEVHVIPVDKADDFKRFYEHLNVETSDGIAWGITGDHKMYLFINDVRNPFIIRQNIMPCTHEFLHAIYQDNVGTAHITRKYDAPEGREGKQGPAATVIVHDNWYGRKQTLKIWIRWALIWLPITISFYPLRQAKAEYAI